MISNLVLAAGSPASNASISVFRIRYSSGVLLKKRVAFSLLPFVMHPLVASNKFINSDLRSLNLNSTSFSDDRLISDLSGNKRQIRSFTQVAISSLGGT